MPEEPMAFQGRGAVSRRSVLAAMPAGVLVGTAARAALAQPAAADAVSFYLGQVLALATLQAQAVGRLRPLLASPSTGDIAWQGGAAAEASVIGAVASVLGGMEPPPELSGSVGELLLASASYRAAAEAARSAAGGNASALGAAGAGFAEGAGHILLWLDALTAETGNDWGDGLRTLTEAASPAPAPVESAQPAAEVVVEEPTPVEEPAPVQEPPVVEEPVEAQQAADSAAGDDKNRENRRNRKNRQNQDQANDE
jgi:hypothetical protein